MKVLFLDIDGVLNNEADLASRSTPYSMHDQTCFDPKSVAALSEIVARSGAKVVISSMWRFYNSKERIADFLHLSGANVEVIDVTPAGGTRGEEISAWVHAHPEISHFVSIDDDTDARSAGNWVQTTWTRGLQAEHVAPALTFLGVA